MKGKKMIPKNAVKQKLDKRGVVLAEGEVTGHYHAIDNKDAELYKIGDQMLVNVLKTSHLKHQEHKAVKIKKGVYKTGIVQEFDHLSQMVRKVVD